MFIANSHSLDDFICMTPGKGPGTVYSLQQFVYVFFKLPNAASAAATNWDKPKKIILATTTNSDMILYIAMPIIAFGQYETIYLSKTFF